MTSSRFFVHGLELVNVGGEKCEICGERKAVGASISGCVLCARCAKRFDDIAQDLAAEVPR